MSETNFVPLQAQLSSIPNEHANLVQVCNASGLMLKVVKGRYLLPWGYALVDGNDTFISQLIDSKKLVVIETEVGLLQDSTKDAEHQEKPKRKSRKKIAAEEKQAIENLGDLFK